MRPSIRYCEYQVRWAYMDSDPTYEDCGHVAVQETSEGYRCEQHKIRSKRLEQEQP